MTTVNVIFPSDRLVDGKLWPHYIGNMIHLPYQVCNWFGIKECTNTVCRCLSMTRAIDLSFKQAISESIPFAKEWVEIIELKIWANLLEIEFEYKLSKMPDDWSPAPDKLYSFEFDGEVKTKITKATGIGTIVSQEAVLVPAHAKEESQEELWSLLFQLTREAKYDLIKSKLRIIRK